MFVPSLLQTLFSFGELTRDIRRYPWYIPQDITAAISRGIYHGYLRISSCLCHGYSFIYRLGRLRPSQDFGCFFGSRWDQRSQVQPVAKKSGQKSGCIVQPFGCMCAAIHAAKWLHKCSQMAACLQPKLIYLQPMSAAIWLHVCSHCAAMPKTCSPCAATVSSVQPMCSPCAAIPSCSNPDHARNTYRHSLYAINNGVQSNTVRLHAMAYYRSGTTSRCAVHKQHIAPYLAASCSRSGCTLQPQGCTTQPPW